MFRDNSMKYVTILIYLIYIILLPFLIAEQLSIKSMIILSVLFLLIFSVSYYWVFVTVHHAKHICDQAGYLRWYVILILFGFISSSASVSLQILNHYQPSIMEYDVDWVGMLFVFSFSGTLLLGAIALVHSEKVALNKETSIFGAFLLFVYLPIGIFFLFKRLKKLEAIKVEPHL
jgi:hypothetical protein